MKNIILLSFLTLTSCVMNTEVFDYDEREFIKLDFFLKNNDLSYVSHGTYLKNNEAIISSYLIDDKYNLFAIKVKNVDDDIELKASGKENFESYPSHHAILQNDSFELKYNITKLLNIQPVNSLNIYSDNTINEIASTDSLKVYSTNYKYLWINYNDNPETRIYLEKWNVNKEFINSEVGFLKKIIISTF